MDGGGRWLRSIGEGLTPRLAGAHAVAASGSTVPFALVGSAAARRPSRRRGRRPFLEGARLPGGVGLGLVALLFASTGLYGCVLGGHYDDFVARRGEPRHALARWLGLGIDRVTISGLDGLNEIEVLQATGIDSRVSLAFLDAAAVRERLLGLPLVKDAAVRKLYPSSLSITLTEGEPFALWQNHGEVFVISKAGTVIEAMTDPRFNDLPLVVGEGAAARAADFLALIDDRPEVKAHMRAAMLTGTRRWNLKLDNGLDVKLPEDGLPEALRRLGALIEERSLLDKDILGLDMRQPDRLVLRLTEEAAAAREEALKAKVKAKGAAT